MTDFEIDPLHNEEQTNLQEITNKVRSPWRRYFARVLDISLYSYFVVAFQALVLNVNMLTRSSIGNYLDTFIAFIIMMLLEPLLLSKLGTTPGKWLLGLRVTGVDGQRLTYVEGLNRTLTVFWRGFGLNIPIYNLVRLWKGYKDCKEGEILDWECDSVMHLKDQKKWRTAVYIVSNIMLITLLTFTYIIAAMPRNRGELTVAEFSENYNQLADYYEVNGQTGLSKSGAWETHSSDDQMVITFGNYFPPIFTYTEDSGQMTGLKFKAEIRDKDAWITPYNTEIALAILAYVNAQEGSTLFSKDVTDLIKQIDQSPFEDFQFTIRGISISCDYEYSGYVGETGYGTLFPNETGEDTYFSIEFKMEQ